MSRFIIHDYLAKDTGVSSAALNASTDMSPIPVNGADLVTAYLTVVNATGIALPIVATMQCRKNGSSVWSTMQTRAIIAGVETMSNRSIAKTTAAVATTYRYEVSWEDINADEFRLTGITAAGAGATDLITIEMRIRQPVACG